MFGTALCVSFGWHTAACPCDGDGIRTQVFGIYRYQLVDGTYERVPITTTTTEHHYVTQNGKVVRETIGTGETAQVLDFTYDADGRPFALTYTNGTADPVTYYYVLNLQGDVVKLVEHRFSGRVYNLITVAEYTYDAWGKPLSTTDGEGNTVANTHIAKLNPLRYRGYYFDMETGFYYLQSRYYDPTLRRFINADSYQSTGQGIVGTNMFAYCNNCPVAFADHEGGYCTYAVCETDIGTATYDLKMMYDFLQYAWANDIQVYHSRDSAAENWAKENRHLGETREIMAYIYKYYDYYYLSDTYVGSSSCGIMQANVITPTLCLELHHSIFAPYGEVDAQIHTHPKPRKGYHNDFPSVDSGLSGGDRIAMSLFGYRQMYIVCYHRCDGTQEIIKYTDPSTWCQDCFD